MNINQAAEKLKTINKTVLEGILNVNYDNDINFLDSTVGSTEPEFIIKAANISNTPITPDEIIEIYKIYLEHKIETEMTPYQALMLSKTFKSKRDILVKYIYQDQKMARAYELYILKEEL